MAAALVGAAFLPSFLNVLFDRLSEPEVVNWIRGKKLDQKLLDRLKRNLYAAQALLNDAEKKQITDPGVKNWLNDLEDAVYKADDLLDELSTEATNHPGGNFSSRFLKDREMVSRMEDIIDTIESILKLSDTLGLGRIPIENMSGRTPSTSLVKMSDIYGREKDKEAIVKLLLDDDASGGKLSLIPIVGMGGLGKNHFGSIGLQR